MLVELEIGDKVIPHLGFPECGKGGGCPKGYVVTGIIRTPHNIFSYVHLKCMKCGARARDDLRVSDQRLVSKVS